MGAACCLRCLAGFETCLKPFLPLLLLALYTFVGAALFELLEEPAEVERLHSREERRRDDLHAATINIISGDKDNLNYDRTFAILKQFQENVYNKTDEKMTWNFDGALFYAMTLYTTIGYGNLYPQTPTGRWVTILYTIIGIPIAIICLMRLSWLFASVCKGAWHLIKWCKGRRGSWKRVSVDKVCERQLEILDFPVWLVVGLTVAYVFGSAAVFCAWEREWTFAKSFYFTVMTFTTVGLGDVLPSRPREMMLVALLVLLGLALVSSCLTIIQWQIEALIAGVRLATDRQYQATQVDGEEFGVEMSESPAGVERALGRAVAQLPGRGRLLYTLVPERRKAALKGYWRQKASMRVRATQTDEYLLKAARFNRILEDDVRSRDDVNSLVALCDYSMR